jgi:hypothetical protein
MFWRRRSQRLLASTAISRCQAMAWTRSRIAASSFSGLLTRVLTGQLTI